jgi:hypothetical protein
MIDQVLIISGAVIKHNGSQETSKELYKWTKI